MELENLVGLDGIKEYCSQMRHDLIARAALGDAPLLRNVIISGNLGTGKKLGARIICDMARALGAAKGMTTTEVRLALDAHVLPQYLRHRRTFSTQLALWWQTTLEQLVLDVRRDVSCVIVSELTGAENVKAKVNLVLGNFPRHLFVFIGATQVLGCPDEASIAVLGATLACIAQEAEALHGAVTYFRKVEPAWLQLRNYSAEQLAAITEQQISASGYERQDGLTRRQLQQAICSTWSRDVLAMRNAHLATELVERAISNRNCRCLRTSPRMPSETTCPLGA